MHHTNDLTTPEQGAGRPSLNHTLSENIRRIGYGAMLIGALVCGIAGCTAIGRGWIPSVAGGKHKANFSFSFESPLFNASNPIDSLVATGKLKYEDKAAESPEFPKGPDIRGAAIAGGFVPAEIVELAFGSPFDLAFVAGNFEGKHEGKHAGPAGSFVVIPWDSNLGASPEGDGLAIFLYPFVLDPTDPGMAAQIAALTLIDYFNGSVGIIGDAIYMNSGGVGVRGHGHGRRGGIDVEVTDNGGPIDLGGSAVSIGILALLGSAWLGLTLWRGKAAARA